MAYFSFLACRFFSDKNDSSSLEDQLSAENELDTVEELEQNSLQKSDVQDSSESGNDAKSDQAKSITNSSKPVVKPTEPDFFGDRYATDDIPSQTVSVFGPSIVSCLLVS